MHSVPSRVALREWLEVVPHDKLCWATDSSTSETIGGNGRCTLAGIAGVLVETLRAGMLDYQHERLAFVPVDTRETLRDDVM